MITRDLWQKQDDREITAQADHVQRHPGGRGVGKYKEQKAINQRQIVYFQGKNVEKLGQRGRHGPGQKGP